MSSFSQKEKDFGLASKFQISFQSFIPGWDPVREAAFNILKGSGPDLFQGRETKGLTFFFGGGGGGVKTRICFYIGFMYGLL